MHFLTVTALLMIWAVLSLPAAVGQGCPACSNPFLESGEQTDRAVGKLKSGSFRISSTFMAGLGFDGSHPAYEGLTSEGALVDVPEYYHISEINLYRTDMNLEYAFAQNWSLQFSLPYEVYAQSAELDYEEGRFTDEELQQIERQLYIHHRNETYYGFADPNLKVNHRFLIGSSQLDIAAGTTFPLGRTEENPVAAGQRGEKHNHIQHGTGTFDPVINLYWLRAFGERFMLSAFSANRLPFYENEKSYSGPLETSTGVGGRYRISETWQVRSNISFLAQGLAYWDDEPDPNSGLNTLSATAGLLWHLNDQFLIDGGLRMPVYQQTLSEGDVFELGPTFMLTLSYRMGMDAERVLK
jgi:hypothetical protein